MPQKEPEKDLGPGIVPRAVAAPPAVPSKRVEGEEDMTRRRQPVDWHARSTFFDPSKFTAMYLREGGHPASRPPGGGWGGGDGPLPSSLCPSPCVCQLPNRGY